MKNAGSMVVAALAMSFPVSSVGAQQSAQAIEDMVKWQTANAVHYDVVAEYTGTTAILMPPAGAPVGPYRAQVKDHYEISFDWNPGSMEMVGKPVFKNFPATLPSGTPGGTMFQQACPPPKVNGTYDHVEVVGAKTGMMGTNSLELSVKRTFPAGSVPYAAEGPCNNWLDVPAKTETTTSGMLVPPGMYFAMPSAMPSNLTLGKDGKTMTLRDNEWTYTYTLRIVN